ncbi:hypothetical protein V8F20_012492 [Naviculisporaceae sp. PSN 640]
MSLLPKAKAVSVYLEVPGRQGQDDENKTPTGSGSETSSLRPSESSSTLVGSLKQSKVKSEEPEYYDIELDDLPIHLAGTYSTDNLVRPPSSCSTLKLPEYLPAPATLDEKGNSAEDNCPVPDYKSVSLRWPFIVFLLVLIAGMFAFLEYQIHDLPPPRYSMIQLDQPEPRARIPVASPDPNPDPRPVEEDYPKPPAMTYTKCGWEPPSWTLQSFEDPACDGFTCEEWPELCNGNRSEIVCMRTLMMEYIYTFTTDDPSWCPCDLFDGFEEWGNGGNIMEREIFPDSPDPGCVSVMFAIQSFNHYKTTELATKTIVTLDGPEYHSLVSGVETYTTPPLPIKGYWPYPSVREEDGSLMFPMVTRTAGRETKDAFGRNVQPQESGLFPDKFYSRMYMGEDWAPAGCWLENVWHSDHLVGKELPDRCSDLNPEYETVWWALPLTRPGVTKSSQAMFTMTTTTSSSESPVRKPKGGSPEVRTTTSAQPTCTACASSSTVGRDYEDAPEETGTPSAPSASNSAGEGVQSTTTTTTSDAAEPINTNRDEEESELPVVVVGTSSSSSQASNQDATPVSQTQSKSPSATAFEQSMQPSPSITPPPRSHSHSDPPLLPIFPVQVSVPPNSNSTADPDRRPSPRPRPQGPIAPGQFSKLYNLRSEVSYLMASVIPVLLATLLSIPVQVFTSSLCRTFPFRALNRARDGGGAPAKDTVLLPLSGGGNGNPFEPLLIAWRFVIRYRDPLPFMSVVLGLLAGVILVPVSSEVIRLEFTANCQGANNFPGGGGEGSDGTTFVDHLLAAGNGPNARLCAFGVRKEGVLIRVAEGILIALAVLVLLTGLMLSRWKSGVGSEPWSIAGMATLLSSERSGELSGLLRTLPNRSYHSRSETATGVGEKDQLKKEMSDMDTKMEQLFEGKRFKLGCYNAGRGNDPREKEYGLQVITPPPEPLQDDNSSIKLTTNDPPTRTSSTSSSTTSSVWAVLKRALACENLELALRIIALVFTTGLLTLILYYECTIAPDTAFERFMNSQSFGVRILFTAFGTVITTYWSYYFAYVSEPQIHHQLAASSRSPSFPSTMAQIVTEKAVPESTPRTRGQPANTSILLTPPFNIFTGIYRSFPASKIFSRFRNPNNSEDYPAPKDQTLTFHISLATLLAKFTPILLSNIPFSNAVTWKIHEACTWLSVAFLSYMVLVLAVSLVLPYKDSIITWIKRLWWSRLGRETTIEERKRQIPYLPLKVDTIAGHMYYLCHSEKIVRDFEGMVEMPTKERDKMVCRMGRRYFFGEVQISSCSHCLGPDGQELQGKRKPSLAWDSARDTSVCTCKDVNLGNGKDKNRTVIGVGFC